jgi:hypothetical protein
MSCDYTGRWSCAYTWRKGTSIHSDTFNIDITTVGTTCRFTLEVINDQDQHTMEYFDGSPVNNRVSGTVCHPNHDYSFILVFNSTGTAIIGGSQSTRTKKGSSPPQPNDMGTITGTKG